MNFCNIKESGTNNILMWAISNNADVKNDLSLQSIINDELSYIVTIKDVNFFQLFRLTQIYRDKIRIIDENKAEMPSNEELEKLFNGIYKPDPNDSSKDVKLYEIVNHCGNMFINLAMQMTNDDHIISPSAVRMYLPMISRKFTVQIPIEFIDIINAMSIDEANSVYNKYYPETLRNIIEDEVNGVKTKIQLTLLKFTSIIKYDKHYEKYINFLKYSPLKSCNNNKLYKIAMLGFYMYDNISKSKIRIDLFNSNKEKIESNLKHMAIINSNLEIEFVIQLPIQYMQMLENYFSDDILTIAYESSMSNIIDNGIVCEDFITPEYTESEEEYKESNNSIESYRVRINEANQTMLNSMPILLNADVDVTSIFSIMPSIYSTRAVMRLNMNNTNKLLKHYDPIINEMLNEAINIGKSIMNDINNYK